MLTLFTQLAATVTAETLKQTEKAVVSGRYDIAIEKLTDMAIGAGKSILMALLIFIVGRFAISLINKFFHSLLEKRRVEPTVQSFLRSLVNILLMLLLVVAIVGALGINTTSFAALLASAGVAIGMALSGNLQNFAGGLIILLFKPYKAGDWIEAQGVSGTVREIQIFHTILVTADNKVVYVPNGSMSSGVVTNYSRESTRRIDWVVGVEYGQDLSVVEATVMKLIEADSRILNAPAPFISLSALADSSVNVVIRVWVRTENYWDVYFEMQKNIYNAFNSAGISFPFPQLTIHRE